MNIIDSSAWIEFFMGSQNGKNFSTAIQDSQNLLVPTIVLLEVFKKMLREVGEEIAEEHIVAMKTGKEIELSTSLALSAAVLSHELKLPMVDAIIYATAQEHNATIWTQDANFKDLENIKYFAKKITK